MSRIPLKILLIDDDEDAYVATRYLLSGIGEWQVELDWSQTYDEGLAAIDRQAHDLYLIDYRLNTHDGLELLRAAVARGCRAPMIILTGLHDRAVDIQAMQAGAADYLVKDRLNTATLERSIRYALERQRLHQALEDRAMRLRVLVGQLSRAEQRERSRIARLLHDHFQQILVSAKMHAGSLNPDNLTEQRQRIQELLDQVLSVSRTLTVELSPPILLDAGLAAALTWLCNWVKEHHGLNVSFEIDHDAEPEAEYIRYMLFHGVRELLLNVRKHARVDQAHLTMSRDDDQVRVDVRDEGAGFEARTLDTAPVSRSGFGLPQLRERLRLVGGDLDLDTAPGQGCRVTMRAPRSPIEAARAGEHEPAPRLGEPTGVEATRPAVAREGHPIRVVVVDDHPVMREGLARTLADQHGIEVVGEAADGQEGIELTQQLHPDVVVMDVVMPRLNGIDATRWIATQMPDVRVIGLSMHNDQDMARAMFKAGAAAYVSKDDAGEILIEKIRGNAAAA